MAGKSKINETGAAGVLTRRRPAGRGRGSRVPRSRRRLGRARFAARRRTVGPGFGNPTATGPATSGVLTSRLDLAVLLHVAPHQPMPLQAESPLGQPSRPPLARADAARIIQQSVLFFLDRNPGELAVQWVGG